MSFFKILFSFFFFNLILIYEFVLIFSFFNIIIIIIIIIFFFFLIFIFIYFIFRYSNYRPPQNSFTFFSLMKFSIPPTFDELFKRYLSVFEELFKHLLRTKFSSCVSNSPNHTCLNYYLQRRSWGCCNIQDGVLCDNS